AGRDRAAGGDDEAKAHARGAGDRLVRVDRGGRCAYREGMIPTLIYGTAWKEEETERLTRLAIEAGFRAIDTANQRRHYLEAGGGGAGGGGGRARARRPRG